MDEDSNVVVVDEERNVRPLKATPLSERLATKQMHSVKYNAEPNSRTPLTLSLIVRLLLRERKKLVVVPIMVEGSKGLLIDERNGKSDS